MPVIEGTTAIVLTIVFVTLSILDKTLLLLQRKGVFSNLYRRIHNTKHEVATSLSSMKSISSRLDDDNIDEVKELPSAVIEDVIDIADLVVDLISISKK